MDNRKWTVAGWMAIGAAALTPPNMFLSFLSDTVLRRNLAVVPVTFLAIVIGLASTVLALFALYRFRELLNERYQYHGVDGLITFAIIGVAALTLIGSFGRAASSLIGGGSENVGLTVVFLVPIALIGAAVGIVSIIIGAKLFGLETDLQSLMRPYAVLSIVGGACFALILLAPIGLMVLIAEHIVLALIFFRAEREVPAVEFV